MYDLSGSRLCEFVFIPYNELGTLDHPVGVDVAHDPRCVTRESVFVPDVKIGSIDTVSAVKVTLAPRELAKLELVGHPNTEVHAIDSALRAAADKCDVMITSGGVSMGDFDFVKQVLMRLGDLNWMQVAIKPAKPFAFGEMLGTPIFGLPGNPVSSSVSFELFARPSLLKMRGRAETERLWVWA